MNVAFLGLVLALAAEPALPFGGKLPYPAPKLIQVTERTKCDMGSVLSIDTSKNVMRGVTPAGLVIYIVGPEVQVFAKDGRPLGGLSVLSPGQKYRAYYLVDEGARVLEIDLDE
jgi:hypothetical protein